jgi:MFS family permease
LPTVIASTLVLPLGVPLISPLLPLYGEVFVVSDFQASLLVSIYFIPVIVLSPAVGIALDRWGRRPVLVGSLLAFGMIGVGMIWTTDFTQLVVARLALGAAAAGVFCSTVTIIADSFEGVQRTAVFGINVSVLTVGRALYPLLGGAFARYGWNVPFAMYGLSVLVAGFVYVNFAEPSRVPPTRHVRSYSNSVSALKSGNIPWLIGATIAAETVTFGMIFTTLPFMLNAVYDATPLTTGAILAATTIATALTATANGLLFRRISSSRLVAIGFVFFGVSLLGLSIVPGVRAVAAVGVLYGAGIGLILPSVDASISDTVSADLRASAMSLRNSATGIGKAIGPGMFTVAATAADYQSLILVAAVGTLGVGVAGLWFARG